MLPPQAQKRYYLQQQLEAIKKELRQTEGGGGGLDGDDEDEEDEMLQLKTKLEAIALPEEARQVAKREFRRLSRMQPQQPEFHVIRGFLEVLSELPWDVSSRDKQAAEAQAAAAGALLLSGRLS